MLFNSFPFILCFWPLTVVVYHFLAGRTGRRTPEGWLVISSLAFYGWARVASVPVLVSSIIFNWLLARTMASATSAGRRRAFLWVGLTANIACLAAFKYAGVGWGVPLGLSFFTLQQVMYLVDCYERLVPANGLLDHATFVSCFPYIASGPLTRAKMMVLQFRDPQAARDTAGALARALLIFAIGLFKKVVFADSFGRLADAGFLHAAALSTLEAWVASVAYTLQIYFDFSGYSDMAIGVALALGFVIPENFNAPYQARSIIEFWQRWHITLSTFITTYLYTPIVRSLGRVTLPKAAVATLAAMTIVGAWHGAGGTFVVFGALHGIALVTNQIWKRGGCRLPALVAWAVTFAFVNAAFVVFRSPTLGVAASVLRHLLPGDRLFSVTELRTSIRGVELQVMALPLVVGAVLAFVGKTSTEWRREFKPTWRTSVTVACLMLTSMLFMNSTLAEDFLYFAF
jgi:alginate O-acetyltransferase complex protein AlgI